MVPNRISRCTRLAVLGCVLVSSVPLDTASIAAAAEPCPAPYPVGEILRGDPIDGLTVEVGTSPDPFTGQVLGVIEDGIALGTDLIVIEADSPAIQRAGGIWSGMSGSPVYAGDGRLIGAVAYGLSWGASPIAGVTPARAMYDLLPGGGPVAANAVELPSDLADEIVSDGLATAAEVSSGLTQLSVPLGVSGMRPARQDALAERLGDRFDVELFATGSARGTDATGSLEAGGNVAVGLTYGDVSLAAIGTVTAVCDQQALLFGHPFRWTGGTRMSAHRAEAVLVQPGSAIEAGFKVAQPGEVVGTVVRDRLAGLRTRLGVLPDTSTISGTLARWSQTPREATTEIVTPGFLANATWIHVLTHIDAVSDRIGGGVVTTNWTITGRRANGDLWRVRRHDAAGNRWDPSWAAANDMASRVASLQNNRLEKVTIERITYDGSVKPNKRTAVVVGAERRINGQWRKIVAGRPLQLVAGSALRIRAVLKFQDSTDRVRVRMTLAVPTRPGARGNLAIVGGQRAGGLVRVSVDSFDDMLVAARRAPSGDEIFAAIDIRDPNNRVERLHRERFRTVVGGRFTVPVRIIR